jgi:hypothetical protein
LSDGGARIVTESLPSSWSKCSIWLMSKLASLQNGSSSTIHRKVLQVDRTVWKGESVNRVGFRMCGSNPEGRREGMTRDRISNCSSLGNWKIGGRVESMRRVEVWITGARRIKCVKESAIFGSVFQGCIFVRVFCPKYVDQESARAPQFGPLPSGCGNLVLAIP